MRFLMSRCFEGQEPVMHRSVRMCGQKIVALYAALYAAKFGRNARFEQRTCGCHQDSYCPTSTVRPSIPYAASELSPIVAIWSCNPLDVRIRLLPYSTSQGRPIPSQGLRPSCFRKSSHASATSGSLSLPRNRGHRSLQIMGAVD